MPYVSISPGVVLTLAVLGSIASPAVHTQDKYEREKNVKPVEVPDAARSWLRDAFEAVKSPKWYKELYESGYSYEAKFKWRGQYYSVEFDPDGTLQDVEIEVDFSDLPSVVRQNVTDYMSTTYRQFEISRLQIQYSGASRDLEDFFDDGELNALTVRYEIEYTATTSNAPTHYREGLFDDTGRLISSRRVIQPPTENLIF
jgi:hypothetical protein